MRRYTVERVPVGQFGSSRCSGDVIVQFHQFWEVVRDDLCKQDSI